MTKKVRMHELSDKDLLLNLYITQFLLVCITLILNLFVFKSSISFFDIFRYEPLLFMIGIGAGLFIVFVDILMMKFVGDAYFDDGGINKLIFTKRHPLHIAFIAAIVAICEEILFRGTLQVHLGLWVTSIIFALIHYRYLFNRYLLLNILFSSLLIGFVFEWTHNLWVTIILHFIVDFILGCFIRFQVFTKG